MNQRLLRKTLTHAPLLLGLLSQTAYLAHAADTSPEPAPTRAAAAAAPADRLATARALIASDKWVAAIDELKRVGDSGSADWNNLMGYSHRKARKPDHAAAERDASSMHSAPPAYSAPTKRACSGGNWKGSACGSTCGHSRPSTATTRAKAATVRK